MLCEKKVMEKLDSTFVVNLVKTFQDDWWLYLLLDACLGGELFTIHRRVGSFDEMTARFYTGCVIEGERRRRLFSTTSSHQDHGQRTYCGPGPGSWSWPAGGTSRRTWRGWTWWCWSSQTDTESERANKMDSSQLLAS